MMSGAQYFTNKFFHLSAGACGFLFAWLNTLPNTSSFFQTQSGKSGRFMKWKGTRNGRLEEKYAIISQFTTDFDFGVEILAPL